ncbi:MAG: MCE family protein [Phycisphaerales bacterium]|nr:MAG: MCE family protein [Phycisphaerales bacterium]
MTRTGRDVLIGLTVIAGFVGLVVMLALFGELSKLTERDYTFEVQLDTARGLSGSSVVTVNGVRVGSMKSLTPTEDPRDGVVATLAVREGTVIPSDFEVFIDASLLGQAALELSIPPQASGEPVRPGDRYTRKSRSLIRTVQDQLAGPVANVADAAERIATLAETYDRVGRRIDDLLAPRSSEAMANGGEPNIATTLARLDRTLAGVEAWTGDESLREETRGLLERATGAADRAARLIDRAENALAGIDRTRARFDGVVETAQDEIRVLSSRAEGALARIGGAADEVRSIAAAVTDTDGTVGRMLRHPDLYNNLSSAAARLDAALVEFQLLVEKFKAEGVPIQF